MTDFNQVLDIYRYSFFQEPIHREFVREQYHTNFENVCGSTHLILPPHLGNSKKLTATQINEITHSLLYRYPVYFGQPKTDYFNWKQIQHTIGYGKTEADSLPDPVLNHRYAILGKVSVMSCEQPLVESRRATEEGPNTWICHLWGVNLESTGTVDYQQLVANTELLDQRQYLDRQRDIFHLIVKSALVAKQQDHSDGVDIRIPMIGMGAFLSALPSHDRIICQKIWLTALAEILRQLPNQVHLNVCLYQPDEFGAILSQLRILQQQYPHKFKLGEGSRDGNILLAVPNPDDTRRTVCVVNAWDNRSYIGNGGSQDPTVDGLLVANAGGYNPQFRNTSYLHNPFFSTGLVDSANWV